MLTNPPIVVGVDGSQSSNDAVWWAAESAVRRDAPLLLVATVFVAGTYGVPIGMPPTYFDDQEMEGKLRLARAADLAREAASGRPLTIESELLSGQPSLVLIDRSRDARMLVVGSRGLGEFTGGLLGSVSTAVAAHARCPVAVIRALEDPEGAVGGPVVVGVDGTKNSEPAVVEAFTEASLRGVELIAVHAWSDVNVTNLLGSDRAFDWTSVRTREEAALSESLAGFGERFPEVALRRVVVQDRGVQALVEFSASAQLVVVGSRGRGGFTSLLLGSTSRALLHAVTCPLLIVHARP
ncbi:universal stress protein [Rhodococcus tukisamuensis]|uniref:Nucleotide-binding universal stress protein, UspA family n=1 Tax=Rhodococcus tukisamuensis TaxID=168276 RepID=A0A1G6UDX3_9NOCA|nr:universal stress protein [Rhodococcus tukisamuensis]SDD38765.1 Nucleotide-binding universal stress protein, UspA family [Rhodococcus tukisamuensis]